MLPNAFIGKPDLPNDEELAAELGAAKTLWDDLLRGLEQECEIDKEQWHSYSQKAGWSLKVLRGKRTILYMGPYRRGFRVAFVLGEKAIKAAHESRLPKSAMKLIDEAKKYPEGFAVRMDVKTKADLSVVKKLAAIKIKN